MGGQWYVCPHMSVYVAVWLSDYCKILVLNVSSGYFIYDYIACTLNDALSGR